MPSSENYKRDYQQENEYKKTPKQIKKRVQRNAARAKMIAAGKAKKGDGKDVAHKDDNTNNNSMGNLKAQNASKNRSFPRNRKAGRK
jgi:hypothetical protein